MGATQSTDPDDEVVDKEYGFRVHHVEENGPGRAAGLESIFDYIVVANGVRTDQDDGTFVRMIKEAEGTNMQLTVFNTHTLTTRETILLPNADWGGAGLLGITIRFDLAQDVAKHTLHVLEVYDESPASNAGLVSYNDYVVGVGDLLFDGPDDFGEIIALNEKRAVRLFVYSAISESMREVSIVPDSEWGGEGCLGCGVGSGYLHQLPPRRRGGRAAARAVYAREPSRETSAAVTPALDTQVVVVGGPPLPGDRDANWERAPAEQREQREAGPVAGGDPATAAAGGAAAATTQPVAGELQFPLPDEPLEPSEGSAAAEVAPRE